MLLDRYQLIEEVGRGASGVVYRACERATGRTVAIKLFREPADGPLPAVPLRTRLQREAALLGRVRHVGVVAVFDVASEREVPFLITEFVPGASLEQCLRDRGPLPLAETVSLVAQAARALHAAHTQGVIHRDIKPANLMVAEDGTLKITDFGVAGETVGRTWQDDDHDGYVWGTPAYLPPERLRSAPLDGRSDLYSLGVVLYTCLTGTEPFRAASVREVIQSVLRDEPAPPSSWRRTVPREMDEFCARALAKNPTARFRDGEEFARALERIVLPSGEVAHPQHAAAQRPSWIDDEPSFTRRCARPGARIGWRLLTAAAVGLGVSLLATAPRWLAPDRAVAPAPAAAIASSLPLPGPPPVAPTVAVDPPLAPREARVTLPPEPKIAAVTPVVDRTVPNLASERHAERRARLPETDRPVPRAARLAAPPAVELVRPKAESAVQIAPPLPVAAAALAPPSSANDPAQLPQPPSTAPEPVAAQPIPNAPVEPEPGRAVIEIEHGLDEGLIEVRAGGRRVALIRIDATTAGQPSIASFRVPTGEHQVRLSVLSATSRIDTQASWTGRWQPGELVSHRWTLTGRGMDARLVERP